MDASMRPKPRHDRRPDQRRAEHRHGERRHRDEVVSGGTGGELQGGGDRVRLFGMHAVSAALANQARVLHRLSVTENAEQRLADAIKARGIEPVRLQPRDLDRLLGAATVHQGVLLEAGPLPEPELEDLVEQARARGPIIVLDQVTDPHNVGAILRSAAVFNASGLVMTRRNSPALSGALAKAASGALEHVPVALVTNLARALEQLADFGCTRIGLDGEADLLLEDADLSAPVALILGSEGRGLRRLTRESCEHLVRIGASGAIASLNVSNAAAVALHAASIAKRR